MAYKILSLLCSLPLLVHAAQHDAIEKRSETSPLAKRQGVCDPGETFCGSTGLINYCARPGNKCCSILYSAPEEATCCDAGTYARPGYYCCRGGGSCPDGETCRACRPDSGNPGTIVETPSLISSSTPEITTPPPVVTTTTVSRVSYTYFTFTITYYYFQYYYVYVPSITRSTSTSSEVTTTSTIVVYAANSAKAQSSFDGITMTASLPTPDSATKLPELPSETSAVPDTTEIRPSITTSMDTVPSDTAPPASASATDFGGNADRVRFIGIFNGSLGVWLVTLAIATGILGLVL